MDAGAILRKIDFNYDRNDFPAVEIDLTQNLSIFCGRKKSGVPERFQV